MKLGKLSREDKQALSDYYKENEVYEPERDPKQEPDTFMPKMHGGGYCKMSEGGYCDGKHEGMCYGGMSEGGRPPMDLDLKKGALHKQLGVSEDKNIPAKKLNKAANSSNETLRKRAQFAINAKKWNHGKADGGMVGYDDGGDVLPAEVNSFSGTPEDIAALPYMQNMANASQVPDNDIKDALSNETFTEDTENTPSKTPAVPMQPKQPVMPMYSQQPQQATSKLNPNQFDDLVAALTQTKGQRISNAATSGLATLADSIMQGVSRAGNPGFAKQIETERQNRQQDLINALRVKYENQFRGQELGQAQQRIAQEAANAAETARAHKANEAETEKERQTQAKNLELQTNKEFREASLGQQKAQEEAAAKSAELGQQSRGWFSKALGINSPEAVAAQKTLQGQIRQPANDTASHIQAIGWAKAHPNDPRAIKILQTAQSKLNGQ